MKTAYIKESPINSGRYVFVLAREPSLGYLSRLARWLVTSLRSLMGKIWRLICFKVILITFFACATGFFVGATWTILELGDLEDEGGEAVELILEKAEI